MKQHGDNPEPAPPVPSWLWRRYVWLLAAVLIVGLGMVMALALGWRSPTPRRAPDWTAADLTWRQYGEGSMNGSTEDHYLQLLETGDYAWAIADQILADFDIELDMRPFASNETVDYGLLYRYQNAANYYLFAVGSDGYYTIAVVRNGELLPLHPWQQWPHVHRGANTNRLRARCQGPSCRFYINGETVAEISSDAFSEGHLGVWAQSSSTTSVKAVLEQLRLWALE